MSSELPSYMAFLVRLWQPGHDGAPVWRASVDNPHTAERHYFADLAALFAFLEEETAAYASPVEPLDRNSPNCGTGLPDNAEEHPCILADAGQRRKL